MDNFPQKSGTDQVICAAFLGVRLPIDTWRRWFSPQESTFGDWIGG